jgi:hypothetical protein
MIRPAALLLALAAAAPTLIMSTLATSALAAPEIQVLQPSVPLSLGRFAFEGGKTLDLSIGIGSGAFRGRGEAPGTIWTVSDRGPNIACGDVAQVAGVARDRLCAEARGGRVYPVPAYAPSIYRLQLDPAAGLFHVTDVIALRTQDGRPIDGLLNPLSVASTEIPLDGQGRRLQQNASALDAEGIVRLADGSFWIGEENAPSIAHVAADGRIQLRIVPFGTARDFSGAGYPVIEGLPAILAKRATNRGIESMAVSPDERFLYFIMQNPLANPDQAAYQQAKNTRLFKLDRLSLRVVGQFVYRLDDPQSFRKDPSSRQNDPRISELTALGTDRLLVLERTENTTKLYEVDLRQGATDIAGSRWDDPATAPSLERSNDLAGTGITPLAKRLVLDTADHDQAPPKLEGVAVLGDGVLFLINDDDFGITGERTRGLIVRGLEFRLSD